MPMGQDGRICAWRSPPREEEKPRPAVSPDCGIRHVSNAGTGQIHPADDRRSERRRPLHITSAGYGSYLMPGRTCSKCDRNAAPRTRIVARLIVARRGWVAAILREGGFEPAPYRGEDTWNRFLKRHAQTLWACGFVSKKVWTTRGLVNAFFLIFIHIKTRRVIATTSTLRPDGAWWRTRRRSLSTPCERRAKTGSWPILPTRGSFDCCCGIGTGSSKARSMRYDSGFASRRGWRRCLKNKTGPP